jgi:cobalt-zinc-cadmium efflux system membrane fusion protein
METAKVEPYVVRRALKLDGTLFVDPSQIARVHSRFAGEVMEIGPASTYASISRPLRFGDHVAKGQLLAVVWCKDLGEKKSELIDALLQLRLDTITLEKLQDLAQRGATSEQKVREAQRARDADWIAYTREVRTLQSWQLTDDEISRIEQEADAIRDKKTEGTYRSSEDWSRVEVRAPIDGEIAEINSCAHDIVDTSSDVMKIVDTSRLRVMCHIYEDDLHLLQELGPDDRRWKLQIGNLPEKESMFDQIGLLIDPNQHTAQVMGWIDNPEGADGHRLLPIGCFVTAEVSLPAPANLVAVPAAAVIDTVAGQAILVCNGDSNDCRVTPRLIEVAQRGRDVVGILRTATDEQRASGIQSLEPGERVVVSGALQLSAELEGRLTAGDGLAAGQ